MNRAADTCAPGRFLANRVRRLYRGGSGIDRLRALPEQVDTLYPEDWIASCVEAVRREGVPPGQGLSRIVVDGEEKSFPDWLRETGSRALGSAHFDAFGPHPAFLTKILDSAERLALQAHPDRETANRLFQSRFGKTEAWIILSTRETDGTPPHVLLGFNERFDRDRFMDESIRGEMVEGIGMLHRWPVEAGDVFLVPGGLIHAIGAGVTMVEVMEPTDYTLVPEGSFAGMRIPDERRFLGLRPEDALGIIHAQSETREAIRLRCFPIPKVLFESSAATLTRLIGPDATECFGAERLTLHGTWAMDEGVPGFRVGIVTRGALRLECGDTQYDFSAGESFFLPDAPGPARFEGEGEALFLFPPRVYPPG